MDRRPTWLSSWAKAAEAFRAHDAAAYATLAQAFADDPESGMPESPPIVLATLRRAALQGRATDPFMGDTEAIRADARRLAEEIDEAVAIGLVQYTDPLRIGDIVPGLRLAARWYPRYPMHIVDLGASAGMLLLAASTSIQFSNASWAPQDSLGVIDYPMAVPPDLMATPVRIESAVGIDLHPLDVRDPATPEILHSYQWPGPLARTERLDLGIRIAAQRPPHVIKGDVLAITPDVLRERLARDQVTVVIDSAFSHYLPLPAQIQLGRHLDRLRGAGPLVLISRGATGSNGAFRSALRAVDLTGRRRSAYAETDLLSEHPRWLEHTPSC